MLSSHSESYFRRFASLLGQRIDIELIESFFKSHTEVSEARLFFWHKENYPRFIAYVVLAGQLTNAQTQQLFERLIYSYKKELSHCLLPERILVVDYIPDHIEESQSLSSDNFSFSCALEILERQQFKRLREFPLLHSLPLDKPRQVQHRTSPMVLHQVIDSGRSEHLKYFVSAVGISNWSCMNALFSLLMLHFSNTHQLITGTRFSLVDNDELIIGESLALPWHPNQCDTLEKFLLIAHADLSDSAIYRSVDTQSLLNRITQNAEIGCHPVYQLQLDYIEGGDNQYAAKLGDTFHFDIQLIVYSNFENTIELLWRYDENIFSFPIIKRMSRSLLAIMDQLFDQPTKSLRDVTAISSTEFRSMSACFDHYALPVGLTINQLIEEQIAQCPERIAIIDQNHEVSYAELGKRSTDLAIHLAGLGLEAGTLVGVLLDRSSSLIVTILALMKLRAVYVPLDPGYPPIRLQYMVRDSGLSTVLTQAGLEGVVFQLGVRAIVIGSSEPIINEGGKFLPSKSEPENDVAYIIYTSGSTGQPKGVAGTAQSLANRLRWMDQKYPVVSGERFAIKTSISFVDHLSEVFQPLVGGATMVIIPDKQALSPLTLAEYIKKYHINRITLIPSILEKLLKIASYSDVSCLRLVMSSGEPLFETLAQQFHHFFNGNTKLINLYGSTETGADVTCYEVGYEKYKSIMQYFEDADDQLFDEKQNLDSSLLHLTKNGVTAPYIALEDLLKYFKDSAVPEQSLPLEEYLGYLRQNVLPYMVNVSYEKFIGHMTAALPSYIPLLSQLLAKHNQNVVKIETSKSITLLERQVLSMMHRLFFDLPESYYEATVQNPQYMHGIITSGGSLANISAMYCARNKSLLERGISRKDLNFLGAAEALEKLGFTRSVILVSRLAHYSVKKAASILGIGENNLIKIDQDENLRVRSDVMARKIQECNDNNVFIIAIIGIAGATETGTIDPLEDLADLAEKYKIHFHVDAAWGGAFMFSELYKHKLKGIDRADSITFCAHKQLYLAQGISLCLFRDPQSIFSISTHADYQSEEGSFDLGQFTLEGSRPANSLQLHASLHLLGKNGYAWIVERNMEKTAYLREILQKLECFQLIGNSDLNIINYRYIPAHLKGKSGKYTEDENKQISNATEMIQKMQFLRGKTFVSRTRIHYPGQSGEKISVFRVVLSNLKTDYDDIVDTLRDQISIANELFENAAWKEDELLSLERISSRRKYMPLCPIGKPIDGTVVYILNECMKPVPVGVIGELYVGGISLAKGYINAKAEATKWIVNPFDHDGKAPVIFKTGDLGKYLESGDIEFCGRYDQQVKLNGCRIELAEIESVLRKFKGVENAVVMIRENLNHENYLVAYLSLEPTVYDRAVAISKIKSMLVGKLPAHMIPAEIHLLDKMPLNMNGKVDLNLLSKGLTLPINGGVPRGAVNPIEGRPSSVKFGSNDSQLVDFYK